MSSTEFSLQSALRSLREEGFVVLDELAVGEHVTTMEQRDFSFLSPYGLDYCNAHILNNPRVRAVIESLLPTCRLGHWLRYQALPGHIECFRRGGVKAGMRVLVVQQWAKGSRAAFHSGSHLHDLPTEKGERSLHETTQLALTTAGCKASEWDFPHGGLTIRDARLYVESKKGYAITFIFATDEALAEWPKIVLPNLPVFVRKVAEMESPQIRLNFKFSDATTPSA